MQIPCEYFIQANGLNGFWNTELPSEREAYYAMSAQTTATNAARLAEEEELLEHRLSFHTRAGEYPHNFPVELREDLKEIDAVSRLVEKGWAHRSAMESRRRYLWMDSKSGSRASQYKWVKCWNWGTDKSWRMPITKGLQHSRYYLGHPKGDFIFQFFTPQSEGGGRLFMGSCTVDRSMFKFRGQVPRPQCEYEKRLEIVTAQVLRALAGIVIHPQVQDNSEASLNILRLHRRLKLDVKEWLQNPTLTRTPMGYFGILHAFWKMLFPTNAGPGLYLQAALQSNTAIGEFAYVFGQLVNNDLCHEWKYGMIISCIREGTGKELEELAEIHLARLQEMAFEQLFSNEHNNNMLVFEDDDVKDVHQFYRQKQYEDDPLNPLFHNEQPDISAVLRIARRIRSPNPKPDAFDDKPAAEPLRPTSPFRIRTELPEIPEFSLFEPELEHEWD